MDRLVTHDRDVAKLRSIALRLRLHAKAAQFRWNTAKINEAADLCVQMADELAQREKANARRQES